MRAAKLPALEGLERVDCGRGAEIWHAPGFLARPAADALLDNALTWRYRQERVRVFGRRHDVPRLTAWFADAGLTYTYSGLALAPVPLPPALDGLRQRLRAATGLAFNSVLANLYRDGRDRMGWHADDERALGAEIHIASVSLGAMRTLRFRAKAERRYTFNIDLGHGSLLLMRHPTQRHWQHCLPARANVSAPRVNLTFRHIAPTAPG